MNDTISLGMSMLLVGSILQSTARPDIHRDQKMVHKRDSVLTFQDNVLPLLQSNCNPCHFPGGKVFAKLPFDDYKTVTSLGKKLNTRFKRKEQQAVINSWIESGALEARIEQGGAPGSERGAEVTVLMKTDSDFSTVSTEKGAVDAFLLFMAEDAVLLPDGANPVTGRENIRKHLSAALGDDILSWQPNKAEVSNSTDLGYTYGTYVLKSRDQDGKPVTHYGKYLTIWRKQADGSWKFILDTGNQSPPPGEK